MPTNEEINIWNEIIDACMSLQDVKIKIIEVTNYPNLN
jgi:hypothetical protein